MTINSLKTEAIYISNGQLTKNRIYLLNFRFEKNVENPRLQIFNDVMQWQCVKCVRLTISRSSKIDLKNNRQILLKKSRKQLLRIPDS